MTGQVVGSHGQPLSDISVGPRPLASGVTFNSTYSETDIDGRFRIRLSRMVGDRPAGPGPDTVSVYVIATDPRSAGVGIPAAIRDSVLTTVTVAPVGEIPEPAAVRITLQKP